MKFEKVLIVGAGRFGISLVRRLSELGIKTVVVDKNEKTLEEARKWANEAFLMDSTDKDAFEEINSKHFDAAIVAHGDDFSTNLLATLYLRQAGITFVVGRASNKIQGEILERIGCNMVIMPEELMGENLAEKLILGNAKTLNISQRHIIAEIPAPPVYWGKPIVGLNLIQEGLILCAVKKPLHTKKDDEFNFISPTDFESIVDEGDFLIILGERKTVAKFTEKGS